MTGKASYMPDHPGFILVNYGQEVELNCPEVLNYMRWVKGNAELYHYNSRYVIQSATLQDEGLYKCVGWNSDGTPMEVFINRVIVGAGEI